MNAKSFAAGALVGGAGVVAAMSAYRKTTHPPHQTAQITKAGARTSARVAALEFGDSFDAEAAGSKDIRDTMPNSDENLRSAVLTRLRISLPGIPDMDVEVQDRIVTVTGRFKNTPQLVKAGSAVWSVSGIRAVVEPSINEEPSTLTTDRLLAKNALSELSQCAMDHHTVVHVTVRHCCLLLDGVVACQSEREQLGRCLRSLPGALGVCNRINLQKAYA